MLTRAFFATAAAHATGAVIIRSDVSAVVDDAAVTVVATSVAAVLDGVTAQDIYDIAAADARRGAEMGELGRVLEAKERAVDSLRETLAETRRTLERRIEELEGRLDAANANARDADRARRAAETRLAEVLLRGEEEKAEAKARENLRENAKKVSMSVNLSGLCSPNSA